MATTRFKGVISVLSATRHRVSWLGVAAWFLLPVAALVVQASSFRWFFPQLVPYDWRPSLLLDLVARSDVRPALSASLGVAAATTIVALLLGVPAAWNLAKCSIYARGLVLAILFVPSVLPPLTSAMGLTVGFLTLGVPLGLFTVVVAHLCHTLPYVVGVCSVVFSRLDSGYLQVSTGLGLSPIERFCTVVWPMTRLGLGYAAYLGFLISWSQYLLTLFAGGGTIVTLPMLVLSLGSGGNLSLFAGLSLLMAIVPMVLTMIAHRGRVNL